MKRLPTLAGFIPVIAVLTASCAQTIPPRPYDPNVARHLRNLSHDRPVTPMPCSHGGWGYYGYGHDWDPY
jgi:hypothetical protein